MENKSIEDLTLQFVPVDLIQSLLNVKVSKFGFVTRAQANLLLMMVMQQKTTFAMREFVAFCKPHKNTDEQSTIEDQLNQMRLSNLVAIDRQQITIINPWVLQCIKAAKEYQDELLTIVSVAKNKSKKEIK